MAEASALNSVKRSDDVLQNAVSVIKEEAELTLLLVKPEPQECAVCVSRTPHCLQLPAARTARGTLLADFLCKFTQSELFVGGSKYVCKSCHELIDVLEQAELEYNKLKDAFEAIISKNPLFDTQGTIARPVKVEIDVAFEEPYRHDSEDEPLAIAKKKRRRKVVQRKIKPRQTNTSKNKIRGRKKQKDGGKENDKTQTQQVEKEHCILKNVKKEDSLDSSETSQSQLDNGLHSELKLEIDDFPDDDDDDDYFPDEADDADDGNAGPKKRANPRRERGPKKSKTIYQCEHCDAKYTSFKRFELHQQKHTGGKPPYICEVCGASYKHKRACDIHIQLHRGISDWKCEECNKLFPSKGALQRHNNIHTGKLNYQCDLCGKSFIHTSSFKMHKLSHSGLKPHTCDICGLALMTRSHLKRHKRVHSGEKRHECAICGKRFSERYNLVAHSKSHETTGEAVVPAAPRRHLFRCHFCQDRFERRYMLERHMSIAHNRTLERSPATPRNTMSKLLKAQAQARGPAPPPPPAPPHTPASDVADSVPKEERSPDAPGLLAHKLQLGAGGAITATTWSGAYAAEFGLRTDYTH